MGDDVTANTDPEVEISDIPGEGGDVVDDDDDTEGAEGGEVEGDAETPPVRVETPARKKKR